jgi:hypothetical protein
VNLGFKSNCFAERAQARLRSILVLHQLAGLADHANHLLFVRVDVESGARLLVFQQWI